jgi:hypothetical protein
VTNCESLILEQAARKSPSLARLDDIATAATLLCLEQPVVLARIPQMSLLPHLQLANLALSVITVPVKEP